MDAPGARGPRPGGRGPALGLRLEAGRAGNAALAGALRRLATAADPDPQTAALTAGRDVGALPVPSRSDGASREMWDALVSDDVPPLRAALLVRILKLDHEAGRIAFPLVFTGDAREARRRLRALLIHTVLRAPSASAAAGAAGSGRVCAIWPSGRPPIGTSQFERSPPPRSGRSSPRK